MKFGILTFHNISNIGATLQAYALCRNLRGAGIDCELVDYLCENIKQRELVPFSRFHSLPVNLIIYILGGWGIKKKKLTNCHCLLENENMISKEHYQADTIAQANECYDGFISGSDMIWDLGITGNDFTYFLAFAAPEKRKIAYGSSADPVYTWENHEAEIMRLLKDYDAIGVRERKTSDFLTQNGLDAHWVADPTSPITPQEWEKMARLPKESDYVLVYHPNRELLKAAERYAHSHNKKVLVIHTFRRYRGDYRVIHVLSPEDWLGYFLKADMIFSNSYHGVLFSIYFQKDFWTGMRDNRLRSILMYYGLERRFLTPTSVLDEPIDYTSIIPKADRFRAESQQYLLDAVK